MTSMEKLHDSMLESFWDHWSVIKHDNWAHCDERVSVRMEILYCLVPGVLVIRGTSTDGLMEELAVTISEACCLQSLP